MLQPTKPTGQGLLTVSYAHGMKTFVRSLTFLSTLGWCGEREPGASAPGCGLMTGILRELPLGILAIFSSGDVLGQLC